MSRKKSWYKGISDEEYNTLVVEGGGVLCSTFKSCEAEGKDKKKKNCKKVSLQIILVF